MFVVPGSSTDISEDWEKDFDLDMTEEEVQLALSKVEVSGEVSWGWQSLRWGRALLPEGANISALQGRGDQDELEQRVASRCAQRGRSVPQGELSKQIPAVRTWSWGCAGSGALGRRISQQMAAELQKQLRDVILVCSWKMKSGKTGNKATASSLSQAHFHHRM